MRAVMRTLVLFACVAMMPTNALAQAVIAGSVKDPSGAVLSGIELELLSAKKVFGTSGRTIWEGTTLGKSLQESIGFALTMGAMLCVRPKCGAEPTDVVSSAG